MQVTYKYSINQHVWIFDAHLTPIEVIVTGITIDITERGAEVTYHHLPCRERYDNKVQHTKEIETFATKEELKDYINQKFN